MSPFWCPLSHEIRLAQFLAYYSYDYNMDHDARHERKSEEPSLPEDEQERSDLLKGHLRSLLAQHGGSTTQKDVVDAISHLSDLNPLHRHTPEWLELFMGEFLAQTSPNFPGRIKTEDADLVQYTLGRLSFNTFQPQNLVCTLRGVRNVVLPKPDGKFTYDFLYDTTVHLPGGDIDAEIWIESYCYKKEERDRMHVCFTGSTMTPSNAVLDDDAKMALWTGTFNKKAYDKAEAERSVVERITHWFLKRILGITVKHDTPYSFRLEFQRAFEGYFDILYLDEDIRITKGNRGTLVVVDRI
jgi:hypothetical protein